MNLASMRIITDDVAAMADFYEQVTGLTAVRPVPDFAQLNTPGAALAFGTVRTVARLGADAPHPADNHTIFIEFRVDDVDAEYARLTDLGVTTLGAPVDQPWGNRSLLFHDPDGNLVNFFTPITAPVS